MANSKQEKSNVDIKKVLIRGANGDEVDLRYVLQELVVYEDMFAPAMTGTLFVEDAHNIAESLPIIGGEEVEIEFTTHNSNNSDHNFSKTFVVYDITEYTLSETLQSARYILQLTTPEYLDNLKRKLRRSYGTEANPERASDIVTKIMTKTLGVAPSHLQVDKSRFDRNIVCAGWTPYQTIYYLANSDVLDSGIQNTDKDSTFLFFEDRFGFKFVGWSTVLENRLHANKTIEILNYRPELKENIHSTRKVDMARVLNFVFDRCTNEIDNTRGSVYSSKTVYHDLIKKTVKTVNFNYNDVFDVIAHVELKANAKPLREDRTTLETETLFYSPNEYHYENDTKTKGKWRQILQSRVQQFENYVIYADVVGNTAHKLGSVYQFDLPSIIRKQKKMEYHTDLSGKYVVTKIKYRIAFNDLVQTLELRKGVRKK